MLLKKNMAQKKVHIQVKKHKKKVYLDGLKKNGLIREEKLDINIKMIFIDQVDELQKKHH